MIKSKRVKGVLRYLELSMGFWALEGEDGSKYELFELPKSNEVEGLVCEIELIEMDGDTINMWGRPAKVLQVIVPA